jgi:hypothetical protein
MPGSAGMSGRPVGVAGPGADKARGSGAVERGVLAFGAPARVFRRDPLRLLCAFVPDEVA